MKKVTLTIYLEEGCDLNEVVNICKEVDTTLETNDFPAEFETDEESLRGSLPKPRRPRQ
jgi:hypothetical protein